jgi:hypothetical protein
LKKYGSKVTFSNLLTCNKVVAKEELVVIEEYVIKKQICTKATIGASSDPKFHWMIGG